jgi:hypothetical protein
VVQYRNRLGLINKSGEWLIEPSFAELNNEHEGVFLAQKTTTSPFGYLGSDGTWAIEPQFLTARDFSDGFALVTNIVDEETILSGYIDNTGKFAIDLQYARARSFSEGLAAVSYADAGPNVGFINRKKELVIEEIFSGTILKFAEGLCDVSGKGGYGFIDTRGRLVIDYKFYVTADEGFSEGLCAAAIRQANGRILNGYINRSGEWVIEPQFAGAEPFKNGIAHVTPNGMEWGYIDRQGKYIWIPTA